MVGDSNFKMGVEQPDAIPKECGNTVRSLCSFPFKTAVLTYLARACWQMTLLCTADISHYPLDLSTQVLSNIFFVGMAVDLTWYWQGPNAPQMVRGSLSGRGDCGGSKLNA